MRHKDRITAFLTEPPASSAWTGPVSLRLPKELVDAVDQLAEKRSTTRNATISDLIRDAVAKKAETLLSEPENAMSEALYGLVAFYEHSFQDGEEIDVSKLPTNLVRVHDALLGGFVREFLDEMHSHSDRYFLTEGSEGQIFRIHTAAGDFIIAKRRFDSVVGRDGTNRECELQTAARQIAKDFPGIAVPKIFSRVDDPKEGVEYVIMQCVPGKTIWTLLLETIANSEQAGQRQLDFESDSNPVKRFFQSRSHFTAQFAHDTEAETSMIEHFRPLSIERGTPDPGTRVRTINGGISFPYLEAFLKEHLAKTAVFDEAFVRYFERTLRPYLEALHQAGIYHRDLNVRNLMLGEDGNIYVIDFGKGVRTPGGTKDDSVYDAQEGKHDSDFSIIDLIRHYGPKIETEADRIRKEAAEFRESLDFWNLRLMAFALGLEPEKVEKLASSLEQKRTSKYFENLFAHYAEGKAERMYGSRFIQANPKKAEAVSASEAGKTKLLAELFLAGPEEAGKFRDFLEAIDPDEYAKGVKTKADRARKYREVFLPFARAVG